MSLALYCCYSPTLNQTRPRTVRKMRGSCAHSPLTPVAKFRGAPWKTSSSTTPNMAPKLTEEEIDDLIYFARAGEQQDLTETIKSLAEREKADPAEIVAAAQDEAKATPLHMAAGNGHLEIVRQLIQYFDSRPKEQKQAFLDEANEHGNTGLHWAALGGHLDMVKLLMEQGASPALANERDYVPLDLALFNKKEAVSDYFLASIRSMEEENKEEGLKEEAKGEGSKEEAVESKDKDIEMS